MRAETGLMRFGGDWCGVFIRGDNALMLGIALREGASTLEQRIAITRLRGLLPQCDERLPLENVQEMMPFEACEKEGTLAQENAQLREQVATLEKQIEEMRNAIESVCPTCRHLVLAHNPERR